MDEHRAFEGIKVLDFTQGIAGPHSTMLLAQHGADVIKIDPLDGDWGRSMGSLYGDHCAHSIAFNRGKRSIALDMKQPEALEVTQKMAAECDVVVDSAYADTLTSACYLWTAHVSRGRARGRRRSVCQEFER